MVALLDPIPVGTKSRWWRSPPGRPSGDMGRRWAGQPGDRAGPARPHAQRGLRGAGVRLRIPSGEIPLPEPAREPVFLGYARRDGRAGTRNYIAVMAASNCAAHTANWSRGVTRGGPAPQIDGVVAFPHGEGCGHAFGPDVDQLRRTLAACSTIPTWPAPCCWAWVRGQPDWPLSREPAPGGADAARERRNPRYSRSRAAGDPQADGRGGRRRAGRNSGLEAGAGLNCGGSDSFSGITANPALGACSDLLAGLGATVVLAETPEIFGAEHLLVGRARNRQVAEKLLSCIQSYQGLPEAIRRQLRRQSHSGQQSRRPDQRAREIAGRVAKAGASPLMDVVVTPSESGPPGLSS